MEGMTEAQIVDVRNRIHAEAASWFINRQDVDAVLDAVIPAPTAEPLTSDQEHALRAALIAAADRHVASLYPASEEALYLSPAMSMVSAMRTVEHVLDYVLPTTVPVAEPAPETEPVQS